MLGESRIIGNHKHSCELLDGGKIRYTVNREYGLRILKVPSSLSNLVIGCRKEDQVYNEGEVWTEKHIRYQCTDTGNPKVLGISFA